MTRTPARRPPPPLRPARVRATAPVTPRLSGVTLEELPGIELTEPASSIRLLLPEPDGLVLPTWTGNEFLLPDGRRPGLRTLTPVAVDPTEGTLDLAVVIHDEGRLVEWVRRAAPGDPVAVSGPGRGHVFDPDASTHLLLGDESALPAIRQLLAAVSDAATTLAVVEVGHADARLELAHRSGATVEWIDGHDAPGTALVEWLAASSLPADVRVWAAGEAAAMQRLRRDLFEDRGVPRAHCTVRGYWKLGRTGT